jgi:hypothetical protein
MNIEERYLAQLITVAPSCWTEEGAINRLKQINVEIYRMLGTTHSSEGFTNYTAPDPAAIIRAAINAAYDAVDNVGGAVDNAYHFHYLEAIYKLSPESILAGMEGK